jgi:hypothetical protein
MMEKLTVTKHRDTGTQDSKEADKTKSTQMGKQSNGELLK